MNKRTCLITGISSGFGFLALEKLVAENFKILAVIRGGETRFREIFSNQNSNQKARLWIDDNTVRAVDIHLDKPGFGPVVKNEIQTFLGDRLDVLINNAGAGTFGSVEEVIGAPLRAQFEVNFFGPLELTQASLPFLRNARGKILNVSSIAGKYTFPLYGAYCASKFALEAMTEALIYDEAINGVQAALIEPGAFKTKFNHSKTLVSTSDRAKKLNAFMTQNSGRQGNPERVARLIVELATKHKVKPRYLVGVDAWVFHLLARILPDCVRVRLVNLFFKLLVFKE